MDASGRFVFVSLRDYASTLESLETGTFSAGAVTGVATLTGVSRHTSGYVDFDAEISADGERLYYVDGRFAGGPAPSEADIRVAARTGPTSFAPLAGGDALFAAINTSALEYAPALTADELEVFFTRLETGQDPQLWRATRASVAAPFGAPERIDAATGFVEAATVTPDGRAIYFHALVGGQFVLRRAAR
jgi:hypothetical protein